MTKANEIGNLVWYIRTLINESTESLETEPEYRDENICILNDAINSLQLIINYVEWITPYMKRDVKNLKELTAISNKAVELQDKAIRGL